MSKNAVPHQFHEKLAEPPLSLPSPRTAGRGWPKAGRGAVHGELSFALHIHRDLVRGGASVPASPGIRAWDWKSGLARTLAPRWMENLLAIFVAHSDQEPDRTNPCCICNTNLSERFRCFMESLRAPVASARPASAVAVWADVRSGKPSGCPDRLRHETDCGRGAPRFQGPAEHETFPAPGQA